MREREGCLYDSLSEYIWLYRGVPVESQEVDDVAYCGEIHPPRPERVGDPWRRFHSWGDTQTGYTSWSTDRSIAEDLASACSEHGELSGQVRIFRVRIETLDPARVFEGRADEDEYLIEGTIEDVEFSDVADEEND